MVLKHIRVTASVMTTTIIVAVTGITVIAVHVLSASISFDIARAVFVVIQDMQVVLMGLWQNARKAHLTFRAR